MASRVRGRLSIRNQLLILILLIIVGLVLQGTVAFVAQQNIQNIQDRNEAYLERDARVDAAFANVIKATEALINYRLEDILSAITNSEDGPSSDAITAFDIFYENLVTRLTSREDNGYEVSPDDLTSLPFLQTTDPSVLSSLNNLVDTTQTGVLSGLVAISDNVTSIIDDLIFGRIDLRENYLTASDITFRALSDVVANISTFEGAIEVLQDSVDANVDLGYRTTVSSILTQLYTNTSTLQTNLIEMQNTWIAVDSNFSTSPTTQFDIFLAQNDVTLDRLNQTLDDLTAAVVAGDLGSAGQVEANFSQGLFPAVESVESALSSQLTLLSDIQNFVNSSFFTDFKTFSDNLGLVKLDYDAEHALFIVLFNDLQASVQENANTAILIVTAVLAILFIFSLVPLVFSLRSSLGRLRSNFLKVAEGNLNIKQRRRYAGNEIGDIEQAFDNLIANLSQIVGHIQDSSNQLADISEELAAGTEQASASISEVSQTVSSISTGAVQQQNMLSKISLQLRDLQRQIDQASIQINEASNFVLKVAQRTNILGLNASINAAKAGQYGRGFGIVANEIRELSQSAKASTSQISELIDRINYSIKESVDGVLGEVSLITDVSETTAKGSETSTSSTLEQVIIMNEITQTSSDLAELAASLNEIMNQFTVYEK